MKGSGVVGPDLGPAVTDPGYKSHVAGLCEAGTSIDGDPPTTTPKPIMSLSAL
jgi:hypothetical protein